MLTPAEQALHSSVKAFQGNNSTRDFTKLKVNQSPATQQIIDAFQARQDAAIEVVLTARTSNPAGSGFYYAFKGVGGFEGRVFVDGSRDVTGQHIFVYDNPVGSLRPVTKLEGGETKIMDGVHFEQVVQEYRSFGKPSQLSQATARTNARKAVIALQVSGMTASMENAQLDRIEAAIKAGHVTAAAPKSLDEMLEEMGLELVAGVTI